MTNAAASPATIDPVKLAAAVTDGYHNVALMRVNDHEVRMSVMTAGFPWHRHPTSDETFLGVDGQLIIEFEDREVLLAPGQIITVPAGILHRTRPAADRSVNLTFERIGAETEFAT